MPELPEVETVCRGLQSHVEGRVISNVITRRKDLRIPFPEQLAERLQNVTIMRVHRRAKYILLELSNHFTLIMHLGMSGKILHLSDHSREVDKHDHMVITLDDTTQLVFNDPRRFGLVTLASHNALGQHALLVHLGPEPLEETFSVAYLQEALQRKKQAIKQVLMDNRVVVGVGNIYACESLFRSHIHPLRPACSLTVKELADCVAAIQQVLTAAIASGGSTLRDYVRSSGDVGYFQHHFAVYGRAGESCIHCEKPVQHIKQAGRSTFYCDGCQK